MPLLGQAALAMWWDIAPNVRAEFEDWHSHEHFPERLGITGFRRGSRWASATGGERFFVMYELETHDTLSSRDYVERLNNPTPWSTKLFPHHRNMVRSQCRVLESYGNGIAGFLLTVRFSPSAAQAEATQGTLKSILQHLPSRPGMTGGHLLRTETPQMAQTAEQKIRGGKDATADWIALVSGYDSEALQDLAGGALAPTNLGVGTAQYDLVRLSFAATPQDLSNETPNSRT